MRCITLVTLIIILLVVATSNATESFFKKEYGGDGFKIMVVSLASPGDEVSPELNKKLQSLSRKMNIVREEVNENIKKTVENFVSRKFETLLDKVKNRSAKVIEEMEGIKDDLKKKSQKSRDLMETAILNECTHRASESQKGPLVSMLECVQEIKEKKQSEHLSLIEELGDKSIQRLMYIKNKNEEENRKQIMITENEIANKVDVLKEKVTKISKELELEQQNIAIKLAQGQNVNIDSEIHEIVTKVCAPFLEDIKY